MFPDAFRATVFVFADPPLFRGHLSFCVFPTSLKRDSSSTTEIERRPIAAVSKSCVAYVDGSFSEDTPVLRPRCAQYARGTAAVVVLSVLWLPVCLWVVVAELRGKEVFPYACPAAVSVALLLTGLAFGLPLDALERQICTYTFPSVAGYDPGDVTSYGASAFSLLLLVPLVYVGRLCQWESCSKADPDEINYGLEVAHSEQSADAQDPNPKATVVDHSVADGPSSSSSSSTPMIPYLYQRVGFFAWLFMALALTATALATPLMKTSSYYNRKLAGKLFFWNIEDCTDRQPGNPCRLHTLNDSVSDECRDSVIGGAAFTVLTAILLLTAIGLQLNEFRRKQLFPMAPLAFALAAAVTSFAGASIPGVAMARRYCYPFQSVGPSQIILYTSGSFLLLSPVFMLGRLFPIQLCWEKPALDEDEMVKWAEWTAARNRHFGISTATVAPPSSSVPQQVAVAPHAGVPAEEAPNNTSEPIATERQPLEADFEETAASQPAPPQLPGAVHTNPSC